MGLFMTLLITTVVEVGLLSLSMFETAADCGNGCCWYVMMTMMDVL